MCNVHYVVRPWHLVLRIMQNTESYGLEDPLNADLEGGDVILSSQHGSVASKVGRYFHNVSETRKCTWRNRGVRFWQLAHLPE
jgi:hypothetical protein